MILTTSNVLQKRQEGMAAVELTESSRAFLTKFFSGPRLSVVPPVEARAAAEKAIRQNGGPYVSVRRVEDIPLPTLDATNEFLIRVYWPYVASEEAKAPVLVYGHGVRTNFEYFETITINRHQSPIVQEYVTIFPPQSFRPSLQVPCAVCRGAGSAGASTPRTRYAGGSRWARRWWWCR
jgi:hypothetical protein